MIHSVWQNTVFVGTRLLASCVHYTCSTLMRFVPVFSNRRLFTTGLTSVRRVPAAFRFFFCLVLAEFVIFIFIFLFIYFSAQLAGLIL